MEIKPLKRPWQKASYQKTTSDPWYQSKEWRQIRQTHIQGFTQVTGPDGVLTNLSNKYCLMCYKESGQAIPMHTADHPIPIKEGGDKRQPLHSLCKRHNFQKTARDGNRQRQNKSK